MCNMWCEVMYMYWICASMYVEWYLYNCDVCNNREIMVCDVCVYVRCMYECLHVMWCYALRCTVTRCICERDVCNKVCHVFKSVRISCIYVCDVKGWDKMSSMCIWSVCIPVWDVCMCVFMWCLYVIACEI